MSQGVFITGLNDPRLPALLAECCCGKGSGSGGGLRCDQLGCCWCCIDDHARPPSAQDLSPLTLNGILECDCMPESPFSFTLDRILNVCSTGLGGWKYVYRFNPPDAVNGSCISCISGLSFAWADAPRYFAEYLCPADNVFTTDTFTQFYFTYWGETTTFVINLHDLDFSIGNLFCKPFYATRSGVLVCGNMTTGFYPSFTNCNLCVGSSYRVTLFE